jgi:hypothetical protein
MVLHDQRVRQLHREGTAERASAGAQALDDLHGLTPLRVVVEGAGRHTDRGVAEALVQNLEQSRASEQCRIEFERAVDADLRHEEVSHPLDLRDRTAVKRRERHAARYGRFEIKVTPRRRKLAAKTIDRPARIDQDAHERHHAIAAQAVQVVSDAHVEKTSRGHTEVASQDLDQHGRFDVLLDRLLDAQLLRPFHVEADAAHVDARSRNAQCVVALHRLQLHEPPAAEPAQNDALRQLRVRPGRRPQRCVDRAAVNRYPRIDCSLAERKAMPGKVKNAVVPIELRERTRDETRERVRSQMGHPKTMSLGVARTGEERHMGM